MRPSLFALGHDVSPPKVSPWRSFRDWAKEEIVLRKLDTPLGYLFMVLVGLFISHQIGRYGWEAAKVLFTGIVLIPGLLIALFHTRFGLYLMLAFSTCLVLIERLGLNLPLDIFLDVGIWMLLFGMLVQTSFRVPKRPYISWIGGMLLLWTAYCLLEWLNPWTPTQASWIYAVREIGEYPLIFFAGLYGLKEVKHIRRLAHIWLGLATLVGSYGLIQATLGFSAFELEWLLSDYANYESIFTEKRLRTFSILQDPGTFGIFMGHSALLGLIILLKTSSNWPKKVLLAGAVGVMLVAMVLSGTRTTFVMTAASFAFIMWVSLNRRIWLTGGILATLLVGVYFLGPVNNPHVQRIRSAFAPQQASSFQVRMENQAYVQPFILDHPIGGGIGSTGKWGKKFSPHTLLSQFPPDSGYVQIAVETGWVGLILYLSLMLVIVTSGVKSYFRCKSPELRPYALGFLAVIFALMIANYPQPALFQHPNGLMFFLAAAALVRLKRIALESEAATPA
ncbi:MAG: O-antigen ligase family protein [Bacteroidota bacterium]